MSRNLAYCHKNFSGEGMRACIYGMLLSNELLPFGVAGGIMDVEGGFAAGLDLAVCTSIGQPPDMIPREA